MDLFAVAAQNVKEAANADKDRDSRTQNGSSAAANFAAVLAKAGMKVDTQAFGVKSDKMLAQAITRQPREEKPERAAPVSENASPRAKEVAGGKRGAERSDGRSEAKPGRAERPDAPRPKAEAKKDDAAPAKDDAAQVQTLDSGAQAVTEDDNAQSTVATATAQSDDSQPAQVTAEETAPAVESMEMAAVAVTTMQAINLASDETFIAAGTEDQPMQVNLAVVDEAPVAQHVEVETMIQVSAVAVQTAVETVEKTAAPVEQMTSKVETAQQIAAPEAVKQDDASDDKAAEQVKAETSAKTVDPKAEAQAALLARIVGADTSVKVSVSKESAVSAIQTPASLVANVALIGLDLAPVAQNGALGDDGQAGFQNSAQNGSGNAQMQTAQAPVTAASASATDALAAAAQVQKASFTEVLVASQAKGAGDSVAEAIQSAAPSERAGASSTAQAAPQSMTGPTNTQTANAAHAAQQAHETKLPIPPREIVNQVTVQIDKAAKEGLDHISIQMRPESLGRIEVRLDLGQDGRVTAMITADRPETLDVLKRDAKGLEQALSDAGLKPDANSLNFSLRGEQQNKNQNANQGQGRANDASGRGLAMDEAEPEIAIRAPLRRAGRLNGVDVQV
jgi:flagellar hook-length control protein FliK